jgi:hypothetical protein
MLFFFISIFFCSLDSSSTASSSINNDPVKVSTPTIKKHSNGLGNLSLNEQQSSSITNDHSHAGNCLAKTVSHSIADLSLSSHHYKTSSTNNRLSTFQSKLDNYNIESYKKIPLSQSFDWGMLAITNTDLILLYNKDKSSLVIFDANGHENEVKSNLFVLIN